MLTMTNRSYYDDAYLTSLPVMITAVGTTSRPRVVEIELDQTPFYPQGGGQPSDQGEIVTDEGSVKIVLVRNVVERIVHEGQMAGSVTVGEVGEATIKWPRRLKFMRVHSAGHLIHDVLMEMGLAIEPVKGSHGDKAFLEYVGRIPADLQDVLRERVMSEVAADLSIATRETSREELEDLGLAAPGTLPPNKSLRLIQIGDHRPMPDGGVHVRSTAEIGEVVIHSITEADGHTIVRYGIAGQVSR